MELDFVINMRVVDNWIIVPTICGRTMSGIPIKSYDRSTKLCPFKRATWEKVHFELNYDKEDGLFKLCAQHEGYTILNKIS